MSASWEERVIALAGIVQASALVNAIARNGLADQEAIETSLQSIFVVVPESVGDVFGGSQGVSMGLKLLHDIYGGLRLGDNSDTLRYTMALMSLSRRLLADSNAMKDLGTQIRNIDESRRLAQPGLLNDSITSELASLYHSAAGLAPPRIHVIGKQNHLEHTANVNRIRALLLAGIRASVLWHQLGGRRWHLVLSRRALLNPLSYVLSLQKYH